MTMQTITMTAILQKMRDLLLASTAINNWSQTKYSRKPIIFIGADVTEPPEESTMPHIILLPEGKYEGLEESEHVYRVLVAWAVLDAGKTTGTQSLEYNGVYNSDALGQLIWECLSGVSANCPASRVEYDLDGAAFVPVFPGYMTIEIKVPVVIGATITL